MPKINVTLDIKDVEKLIGKLSISDKIRLVRKLEQETWQERMQRVTTNIRRRAKKNPISQKEITRICEEVRQELYEERIKSNS